jgi:hypothetical protein
MILGEATEVANILGILEEASDELGATASDELVATASQLAAVASLGAE